MYEMFNTKLNIEGLTVSLDTPRNMLNVLIYVQEQLYAEAVRL